MSVCCARTTRFNDRLAQAQQLRDALGADERDTVEAALEDTLAQAARTAADC